MFAGRHVACCPLASIQTVKNRLRNWGMLGTLEAPITALSMRLGRIVARDLFSALECSA